ncbi:MAG TPA: Uma2 family endonuclease [Thermomicrobiaceae bacterium]|nr:Uma2 family endonuclease [Thermomicrobiaceae bacterium]
MTTTAPSQVLTRYRFSVDDFQRMGEAGIFGEDDRVELLDGEIVAMNPIGVYHATCVNLLNQFLVLALGRQAIVSIQNPIALGEHDEPQPDVAVVQQSVRQHAGHPVPSDVLLLIEVADSTLAYDRDVKLPRYARAGIPETWIVDLPGRLLTRYSEPTAEGYRVATIFRPGETIPSTTLPALQLVPSDILP